MKYLPLQTSPLDQVRDEIAGRVGGSSTAADFAESCAASTNGTLIQNCALHENFLGAATEPFMTMTGGWLPLLFWSVISMVIYLKYRSYLYAMVFAVVAFVGTGIWLPSQAQIYLGLALATGLACAIFTLLWRVPRDTA